MTHTGTKPKKTTAHDAAQLIAALGLSPARFALARQQGLIPGTDMKTPRWSGPVVDELVAGRDALDAALPDVADAAELRAALRLLNVPNDAGAWDRALGAGLIPDPDHAERFYTRALVEATAARAEAIRAAIPPRPLGAWRCADLLSEATGLTVVPDDVVALAKAGLTAAVDAFKDKPLYDVGALHAVLADPDKTAVLTGIVTERTDWLAASVPFKEAAGRLGWRYKELEQVIAVRGIGRGRYGRYALADMDVLAADEELMERIEDARELGPDEAAAFLEIRRKDFDYAVEAGWAAPVRWEKIQVGKVKTVRVPFYRIGDLKQVLQVPGVDWEEVRAVHAGGVSPLREFTRLPATRAQEIHAFADQLRADYGIEVWPRYYTVTETWELDWELGEDGAPSLQQVHADLLAHPGAGQYADGVELTTTAGSAIRLARDLLEPRAAAVVGLKATGPGPSAVPVEVAVLDAHDGTVLLNTLVNPAGVRVDPAARKAHGISNRELAAAPGWPQVLPQFLRAVEGRTILAYDGSVAKRIATAATRTAGLDEDALPGADRWTCVMQLRSDAARAGRYMLLGENRRAADAAASALEIVRDVASPTGPRPGGTAPRSS